MLEADNSDWYKTLREHLAASGKRTAEVDRVFSGIARNATFVNGHTLMTQLVAAGEFDITPHAYLHTVEDMVEDGAPLAWKPVVAPVICTPTASPSSGTRRTLPRHCCSSTSLSTRARRFSPTPR